MGTYDGWRENGGPTLYDSNKTPVTADVLEAGLIFAIVILFFSLIITLPGFSLKPGLCYTLKIVIGVYITGTIMLCNFGQEWEVSEIETKTQYRAGLREEIEAEIGVKIGLRSVNITLKATPDEYVKLMNGSVKERINYNERFSWDDLGWVQGRAGFGPYAGLVNRQFREAQRKGLPYPILWIAEYFTIDGEGIRWGRHYRQAGYYTHIVIWLAWPLWLLSMILMHMVVRYGGYASLATSVTLLTGNILYATIRNVNELFVPFEDDTLEFHWGWCFWLNLINGFLTFFIGLFLVIGDLFFYEKLVVFFGLDSLSDFDEIYADPNEISHLARVMGPVSTRLKSAGRVRSRGPASATSGFDNSHPSSPTELQPTTRLGDDDDDGPPPVPMKRQYRKRTVVPSMSRRRRDAESGAASGRHVVSKHSGGSYEMSKTGSGNNKFLYRSGSGDLDNAVDERDIELSGHKH